MKNKRLEISNNIKMKQYVINRKIMLFREDESEGKESKPR
jgi:hypothetical protein